MIKQKNMIEFIIYLVLLIVGIVLLVKGFHKKDFILFSTTKSTPIITTSDAIPDEQITYDYSFLEDG